MGKPLILGRNSLGETPVVIRRSCWLGPVAKWSELFAETERVTRRRGETRPASQSVSIYFQNFNRREIGPTIISTAMQFHVGTGTQFV